ncbi:protein PARALOG OF AIPP2 isoform X1 [Rosa rugosa]|uniref:protein PARALOG OF AIPP2 isoform X1 n=1 Tax=Rosa rugosa TaxID=74645 RepID=UPI002B40F63E|nr:protein PARALOG OF AIPP2 isoform X1 [Rosa rugosa]
MGSKAVEVSDETCHVSGANHYSVNVSDNLSSFKSKACDSLQQTTSETSNLLSVNSSYDSLSANAESRAPLRFSNTSDDLEGVEKFPNTYSDSKVVQVHEDNISCVSKANDTITAFSNHNRNVERKNLSCSLASVGSVGPEEFGKPPNSVFLEIPPLKDPSSGSGRLKERVPEFSGLMDSSLTKEAITSQKFASYKGLEASTKICPKFEADTSDDGQDSKQEALKCSDHGEQDIKSSQVVEAAAMQPLQSVNGDDSDESDIVEHDVKVCDICGDAGREESLATCSRCSDGAEHIYCMRKMLRRVPKGDWLCEECKFTEQTENQKQGTDLDGNRMKKAILSTQLSNKRRADNIEAAPSSKRQTLETRVGSPKPSSPKRTVALSRESSFKSMDKDKLKSAYQTSLPTNDVSEAARSPTTGPRLQTAKGALLKSNSFNMYTKPKVKLVDNIVPQKQKGSKEHGTLDMKERTARMMGKSVSFRSPDSGRSNVSESKVKMLSSKFNPLQDLKGMKQLKERSTVERKNLSKLERPPVSLITSSAIVSTPKVDQASRGDTSLLSSVSNLREHKALLSDGKLNTSSKAISSLTRKGVETQSSPGGSSPISGMCSAASEEKSNQVISNNEPLSSYSQPVEKVPADDEGKLEDTLRSWEMTNQTDKTRETSVRSRPIVAASSKSLFCSICKEIGHTAESCKSGISQASVTDVSPPRSSREEVPRGSRLKDAIHAALLRKPEIYKKKTLPDQPDELSASNMESSSEVASPEFVSNMLNNNTYTEGSHDGEAIPGSSTSDFYKNTLQPANSVIPSRVVDSGSVLPSFGKSTMRDLQRQASVGMSVLMKTTAIPEYEYIWQGSFELQRGGNILDLCGGIQAHLSTCASPKVLEVVNKFPHKVPLKEVPRLSVWPAQFHQSGVREDNIALYFFAKDLESYERNYKILIDAMIKNDLALKGKFGGVELLILPSNQLPEKSQRWNMLYFLWGVFRETRVHYIDSTRKLDVPGLNDVSLDNDTPTVMALSKNLHVPEHIGAADRLSGAASASKSPEPVVLTVSKDLESKDTYPEEMCFGSKENLVLQDSRVDSEYTTNNAGLSGGVKRTTPSLQEVCLRESRLDSVGPVGMERIADRKNMVGVPGGDEEVILEKVKIDRDEFKQVKELKREDGSKEMETAFVRDLTTRVNSCQSNNRIHPHIDLSEPAASSTTNQEMPWNVVNTMQRDGQSDSKKPKLDTSELHGFSTSKFVLSTSEEEMNCPEACDEKVIPEDLGTTERHFFPVESRNVQDFQMDNNSLPWKNFSSGNEDKSDGFPSLELALRAETKPPSKGNLPFFVGLGDERDNQDRSLEKTLGEKEDDVSASLSLSLSFPFPDKEQPVKPVTKSEQLLPERHHVNTSLLLFGRFPEK